METCPESPLPRPAWTLVLSRLSRVFPYPSPASLDSPKKTAKFPKVWLWRRPEGAPRAPVGGCRAPGPRRWQGRWAFFSPSRPSGGASHTPELESSRRLPGNSRDFGRSPGGGRAAGNSLPLRPQEGAALLAPRFRTRASARAAASVACGRGSQRPREANTAGWECSGSRAPGTRCGPVGMVPASPCSPGVASRLPKKASRGGRWSSLPGLETGLCRRLPRGPGLTAAPPREPRPEAETGPRPHGCPHGVRTPDTACSRETHFLSSPHLLPQQIFVPYVPEDKTGLIPELFIR